MKTIFTVLILFALFTSCSDESPVTEHPYEFRDFINKFKPVKLPYTWRNGLELGELKRIDSVDAAYIKDTASFYYGILEDTTNFFSILTLLPGDEYVPLLTTYDKSGKIISSETIIVRGCSGDPCMSYCSSTGIIKRDLSILAVDSIFVFDCDEFDNRIPGTDSVYIFKREGKLNSSGNIQLGSEQETIQKTTFPVKTAGQKS
ncbi:MAG: hypothetical protein K0S33_3642 [Bacteroidetes bacterium]|jgi:hypothetical protein|nr:hypothetical protein [Bacteroidota bacterium]